MNRQRGGAHRGRGYVRKDIKSNENIHIPKYIRNQPWYYKDSADEKGNDSTEDRDYLVHHRQAHKGNALDIENNSEPKLGLGIRDEFEQVQISQRKGQHYRGNSKSQKCRNCGGYGHTAEGCLDVPRKKRRGVNSDETMIVQVRKDGVQNSDWDAKKDRWFGYTGKEYTESIKKWELTKKHTADTAKESVEWDTDEEVELFKLGLYKDDTGLKEDDKQNNGLMRASVRLREDKAAYLQDINSEVINYDPKSRTYKDTSIGSVDENGKMFRRHLTGEGLELNELTTFTRLHARQSGIRDEVENSEKPKHVLAANPTKYEQLMREQKNNTTGKKEVTDLTQLEAKKLQGTAQKKEARDKLRDLYG